MNSREKQFEFKDQLMKHRYAFGGDLLKRKRNRTARPFSSKYSMHLILKSSRAVGRNSFGYGGHPRVVRSLIDRHCTKYGVKLIRYSNNFNHLHLHLKFASRAVYLRFIRSLTGSLAMAVTGAKKMRPLATRLGAAKFFDQRPYMSVVTNYRQYRLTNDYIDKNQRESVGIWSPTLATGSSG